jgi:hypothetical protein
MSVKPVGLSFEEAAALPTAAVTALQGLRHRGEIRPEQTIHWNKATPGGKWSCKWRNGSSAIRPSSRPLVQVERRDIQRLNAGDADSSAAIPISKSVTRRTRGYLAVSESCYTHSFAAVRAPRAHAGQPHAARGATLDVTFIAAVIT